MARWDANAGERLALAALELFAEQGYENITVVNIAQRAALTKSTFFRHFKDKREILFGDGSLQELAVAQIMAAPPAAAPSEALLRALSVAGSTVFTETRRDFMARRAAVIMETPELREREALKEISLSNALTDALRLRGVPDIMARVVTDLNSLAFRIAYERWIALPGGEDFGLLVPTALAEVRAASLGWGGL